MDKKKYCIFGCGGFGREVFIYLIDYLKSIGETDIENKVCFMVDDNYLNKSEILGIKVIPFSEFNPLLYKVVVAIANPQDRKKIVDCFPQETLFTKIIHPSAVISKWVKIGEGSIITPGTILTCDIEIGSHAHLNLCTTIGHDTKIGNFFTTAPAVNISGKCNIGNCVYIGTNASIRDGIKICDDVVIGMGSNVIKDINEKGVYIGNPAKK